MDTASQEVALERPAVVGTTEVGVAHEAGGRDGRPVFVAQDGRRAGVVRTLSVAAMGLMLLWFVALIAGATGVGRLPGVPLPPIASLADAGVENGRSASGRTALRAVPSASSSPADRRADDADESQGVDRWGSGAAGSPRSRAARPMRGAGGPGASLREDAHRPVPDGGGPGAAETGPPASAVGPGGSGSAPGSPH
jgi:hypothetical protein